MLSASVFINNRSQAVRLPTEVRFPEEVKRVNVRVRGAERILVPEGQAWDSFFLRGPQSSPDFMAERASQTQAERESL